MEKAKPVNPASAKWKLLVSSARGGPNPPNGYTTYDSGTQVVCKVTSPVTEGKTVWTCTGWSGTGSVPSKGVSTDVTFPITEDSTITWNWVRFIDGTQIHRPNSSQVETWIALIALIILAVLSYHYRNVTLTAVSMGAIGGLAHEIVQSGGKFMFPDVDDSNGNYCLGGLFGIVAGGAAGVLLIESLGVITVGRLLIATAFSAGLAFKGIADGPAPSTQPSSS